MEGWAKVFAGVVIGVTGTVYATNESLRKQLPKSARELPDNVHRRFASALSAARQASSARREEILRDLERHDAAHAARIAAPIPEGAEALPEERLSTTEGREATQTTGEEPR